MLRNGLLLLIPLVLCGLALNLRDGRDVIEQAASVRRAPQVEDDVEFTVATYNVQGRPVLDRTSRKFPLISPLLNRYDIVGIQECFQDHALLWGGATHRTKLHYGRLKASWKVVGSGLSTLARFPMLEQRTEFFRSASEAQNRLASKGMLMVRLDLHGRILDLYNAHFDAGASKGAQLSRRAQGAQLAEFVRSNSPPAHSVVVVGDFNMSPSRPGKPWDDFDPLWYHSEEDARARTETFDEMLRDLGFEDAAEHALGPLLDNVDRVLFRAGAGQALEPLSCSRAGDLFVDPDGRPLSDHVPIVVRMRLRTGSSPGM